MRYSIDLESGHVLYTDGKLRSLVIAGVIGMRLVC